MIAKEVVAENAHGLGRMHGVLQKEYIVVGGLRRRGNDEAARVGPRALVDVLRGQKGERAAPRGGHGLGGELHAAHTKLGLAAPVAHRHIGAVNDNERTHVLHLHRIVVVGRLRRTIVASAIYAIGRQRPEKRRGALSCHLGIAITCRIALDAKEHILQLADASAHVRGVGIDAARRALPALAQLLQRSGSRPGTVREKQTRLVVAKIARKRRAHGSLERRGERVGGVQDTLLLLHPSEPMGRVQDLESKSLARKLLYLLPIHVLVAFICSFLVQAMFRVQIRADGPFQHDDFGLTDDQGASAWVSFVLSMVFSTGLIIKIVANTGLMWDFSATLCLFHALLTCCVTLAVPTNWVWYLTIILTFLLQTAIATAANHYLVDMRDVPL